MSDDGNEEPMDEDTWRMMARIWYQDLKAQYMSKQHGDPQHIPYDIIVFNTPEHIRPYLMV